MISPAGINREMEKFMYDILVTTGQGLFFVIAAALFIWVVVMANKDYKDNDWS
jgi:hypothetical protein